MPNSYCKSLYVKGLPSCGLSNFEDNPIVQVSNPDRPPEVSSKSTRSSFFRSPALKAYNFEALWPTEICNNF